MLMQSCASDLSLFCTGPACPCGANQITEISNKHIIMPQWQCFMICSGSAANYAVKHVEHVKLEQKWSQALQVSAWLCMCCFAQNLSNSWCMSD